jgi:hypothetical protein
MKHGNQRVLARRSKFQGVNNCPKLHLPSSLRILSPSIFNPALPDARTACRIRQFADGLACHSSCADEHSCPEAAIKCEDRSPFQIRYGTGGKSSEIGYSLSWPRTARHPPITAQKCSPVCFLAFEACASQLFVTRKPRPPVQIHTTYAVGVPPTSGGWLLKEDGKQ